MPSRKHVQAQLSQRAPVYIGDAQQQTQNYNRQGNFMRCTPCKQANSGRRECGVASPSLAAGYGAEAVHQGAHRVVRVAGCGCARQCGRRRRPRRCREALAVTLQDALARCRRRSGRSHGPLLEGAGGRGLCALAASRTHDAILRVAAHTNRGGACVIARPWAGGHSRQKHHPPDHAIRKGP